MGPDPRDGAGPEKLSAQGRAAADRETSETEVGQEMGIYSSGGSDGGYRIKGDWGLHHEEAEYGRTIYCDANDSGPL